MSKVKIQGHASGSGVLTVTAPNTSTDRTITLPDSTGTLLTTTGSGANLTNIPATDISGKLSLSGGTMTGSLKHGDNVHSKWGTGDDLDIYHDGSDSIIQDVGTGALEIRSNELKIKNAAGNENAVYFAQDGAVNLYHNNVAKLATTATGIAVTGGVAIGGTGTANTLDDYEEGTWTPQMDSDYSSVSYDGDNHGTYTKIGNVVIVNFRLDVNSWSGSSSGYATVCNLPFTVVQDSTFTAANPSWHYSLAEFPGTGYCNGNTTEIVWLRNHTGGDRYHLTGDQVFGSSGDARLCGSATYLTTA